MGVSPTNLGWSVDVPASTSNLGPGFDFLGLCLGLFVRVAAKPRVDATQHEVLYDAGASWSTEDDLVLRTLAAYEAAFRTRLPKLEVAFASDIPVGRGFGSSGAAIAATLLLAAAVDGNDAALNDRVQHLVPIGVALEGHPDNASASLLGGCTLTVPHERGISVVRQPVGTGLGFAVAWPEAPLYTEASRRALPESVPLADAIENPRRLALLLEGLRTSDPELIDLGLADRLHERFRRALIPGSDAACAAARAAGAFGACLSGAGSGLVAIGPMGAMERVAEALAAPLTGGQWRVVPFIADAPNPAPRPAN